MQLSELDNRPADEVLWSARQLGQFFGLGNTAIYDLVARSDFPAAVQIGRRSVRWWKSEVVAYAEARRVKRADG